MAIAQRQPAAGLDIADHIIGFYNNVRLNSSLSYPPPTAYERKHAKQLIAMSEFSG